MVETRQLRGGILAEREDARGMVALLTTHLRHHFELVFYTTPTDIDTATRHDFLLLFSLPELEAVVRYFGSKDRDLPLVVHVDRPAVLRDIDHAKQFPGLRVLVVPQADLNSEPDVTLELDLFAKIRERLRE